MTEAGLDAQIDGIGNVVGFSRARGRKILAGSHIESQNHAGWLDGPLGVIYALEAARALRDDPASGDAGVDVIAFCDEEGHFGAFLGSRSFIGEVTEADIDAARNRSDRHSRCARRSPRRATPAGRGSRSNPRRYVGYFEAHIEQGRTLEIRQSEDRRRHRPRWLVELSHHGGRAAKSRRHHDDVGAPRRRPHAGAPDGGDRPAFRRAQGARTVWTVGNVRFEPGEPSIIPGRAEAMLQFRDADAAVLQRFEAALRELVDEANRGGPCELTIENTRRSVPAAMDDGFQQALEAAARVTHPGLRCGCRQAPVTTPRSSRRKYPPR